MKIAIDCRPLQNRYAQHGIGTVVRNLVSHLVKSRCSTSLILCGQTPQPPVCCSAYRMIRRSPAHDWLQEQVRWPLDLLSIGAGIFHSTVSLGLIRGIGLPLVAPAKRIATVYDLTPLYLPALVPHTKMKSFRIQKLAVRSADRVITISSFVKDELVRKLDVRENKISVLPLAVDEAIARLFDGRQAASKDSAAAAGRPFILAMGEEENKNIITAIRVFELLAAKGFQGDLRIIGALENQTIAVKQLVQADLRLPLRERIVFTGTISIEQMVANYATCSLFLFPSLFEGFGLPVIEAMYCGTPVVASNATSLPEAGGDAAVCCDPTDVEAMASVCGRLLHDTVYRKEIVEKGYRHARKRTWAQAADMVVGLYEELGARFK